MCSNLPSTGTAVFTTGGNLPILWRKTFMWTQKRKLCKYLFCSFLHENVKIISNPWNLRTSICYMTKTHVAEAKFLGTTQSAHSILYKLCMVYLNHTWKAFSQQCDRGDQVHRVSLGLSTSSLLEYMYPSCTSSTIGMANFQVPTTENKFLLIHLSYSRNSKNLLARRKTHGWHLTWLNCGSEWQVLMKIFNYKLFDSLHLWLKGTPFCQTREVYAYLVKGYIFILCMTHSYTLHSQVG